MAVLVLISLIFLITLGLILNNRLYVRKCNLLDTTGDVLTSSEISAIQGVYKYLDLYGDGLFLGLKENKDLVIFNDRYEFLICDKKTVPGWEFVCNNECLNKNIHRRITDNPQAFAVFTEDKWVASMSTKNTGNKHVANAVPLFFPPQILIMDDEYYRGTIVHETVHAFQANNIKARFTELQQLHDVCKNYYDNKEFNALLIKEAFYLKQAIFAEQYEDVLTCSKSFLSMREKRRTVCKMNNTDIQNEKDMEWLEGLARYAVLAKVK
jgi:mannose/fructose/N-acetylgalactosamine-specific phosphotransferase system component IIB